MVNNLGCPSKHPRDRFPCIFNSRSIKLITSENFQRVFRFLRCIIDIVCDVTQKCYRNELESSVKKNLENLFHQSSVKIESSRAIVLYNVSLWNVPPHVRKDETLQRTGLAINISPTLPTHTHRHSHTPQANLPSSCIRSVP